MSGIAIVVLLVIGVPLLAFAFTYSCCSTLLTYTVSFFVSVGHR
jgi:hypothetical protein